MFNKGAKLRVQSDIYLVVNQAFLVMRTQMIFMAKKNSYDFYTPCSKPGFSCYENSNDFYGKEKLMIFMAKKYVRSR